MHDEMKRSVKKEESEENFVLKAKCWYVIKAFNSWAVSLLRYSGGDYKLDKE